jgi:hypothetical protein
MHHTIPADCARQQHGVIYDRRPGRRLEHPRKGRRGILRTLYQGLPRRAKSNHPPRGAHRASPQDRQARHGGRVVHWRPARQVRGDDQSDQQPRDRSTPHALEIDSSELISVRRSESLFCMVTLAGMIRQLASQRCSTNSVSRMDWTFSPASFLTIRQRRGPVPRLPPAFDSARGSFSEST